MRKTTVYLPEDLKAALGRIAAERGESEAELVRNSGRPRPRLPLFSSGDPTLAERFDEELTGFGER